MNKRLLFAFLFFSFLLLLTLALQKENRWLPHFNKPTHSVSAIVSMPGEHATLLQNFSHVSVRKSPPTTSSNLPPLDQPTLQELHEFPGATVLEAAEVEGPQENQKTRLHLLKTDFKYPYIRTEEVIDTKNNAIVMRQEMLADHFLVTLPPQENPETFLKTMGNQATSIVRVTEDAPLYQVKLASSSLEALPAALRGASRASAGISEPDGILHLCDTPNNPLFNNQWGLYLTNNFSAPEFHNHIYQTHGSDAIDAWNVRTDASAIVVAIIDSGIRYTHEDLASNMWTNPAPINNDLHGWNAYNQSGDPMDGLGHGTHCAGTIGASGNNGLGTYGIAWKVQLMACRCASDQGIISQSEEISCIHYAINHGARILNCSYGSYFFSHAEQAAFQCARNAGIIAVCAAGNGLFDIGIATNNDTLPVYPSCYHLDNIVSVAACCLNRDEEPLVSLEAPDLALFSNYGAHSVHLAAPGEQVFSTYGGSNSNNGFIITGSGDSAYAYMDGTSAAAPFVSGAFALLMAQFPGEPYNSLIARLLAATDKLSSLRRKTISGGRLNIAAALTAPFTPLPLPADAGVTP